MRNLSERATGFITAFALAVLVGSCWLVYTQYRAGQIQHQKTEILFQMLAPNTKHGSAIEVADGDGTKRPATRLDLLVLVAEQAADNIKQNQDKQRAATPDTTGAAGVR